MLFAFYAGDFLFTEFKFDTFVYGTMRFYSGSGALMVHLQFIDIILMVKIILMEINDRLEYFKFTSEDNVDVNVIGKKYSKICGFCELVNKCFGLPIVSCCVRCFGSILISANRMVYMDFSISYVLAFVLTLFF